MFFFFKYDSVVDIAAVVVIEPTLNVFSVIQWLRSHMTKTATCQTHTIITGQAVTFLHFSSGKV